MKNTSINRYNVAVVDQSGKVGTVRYFQKGGRTYVRAAANRVDANSNPRTDGQMKTRLLYNSRNAMFRLLKGLLKGAFQFKPRHLSEYQAYMQANAGIGCYMTKSEYRSGKIVLLPVKVAEGELKEIVVTKGDGPDNVMSTDLSVGEVADTSTIGKLSKAIVDNNDGFEYGDQITFIEALPSKATRVTIIKLDQADATSTPGVILAIDGFIVYDGSPSGYEGSCVAAIHSNSEGQMSNSVFALTVAAQTELTSYTSVAQFEEARDSYGKAKESILVPAKEA